MTHLSTGSKSQFSPVAVLLIGILAVSTASLFIRFAQKDVPSIVIAAGRMTIAALILCPFVITRNWQDIRRIDRRTWLFMLLAGMFLGFHFATWITSLEYTTIASSVVLVTTAPLWVALFSPIFLKEKLTRYIVAGLVISLAGSVLVALSGHCAITGLRLQCNGLNGLFAGEHFLGNLLALAGAFLSCGYLIVGRKVRHQVNLTTYAFLVYSIASLVLLLLVLLSGEKLIGYAAKNYIWLIALAIIPQLIGHTSFNWALKYLSAAFVSIALLGEPVGSVVLAYIFLREKPVGLEIIGGVLILAGIFVSTRKSPQILEENPL